MTSSTFSAGYTKYMFDFKISPFIQSTPYKDTTSVIANKVKRDNSGGAKFVPCKCNACSRRMINLEHFSKINGGSQYKQ